MPAAVVNTHRGRYRASGSAAEARVVLADRRALIDHGAPRGYSPATTPKRPLSLRPKTSGKKASSACAGATKKSPGVVARA